MRTMKWVSMITAGLLFATPAFADGGAKKTDDTAAKTKTDDTTAKTGDSAGSAKTDTAKTGDTASTKKTSKKKGHKKADTDAAKTADKDKDGDKDKDADKDKGEKGDKDKGEKGDKDGDDKAAAADSDTTVKAGTGIAKREVVGEGDTFTAGSKVWVWTSVMGQSGKNVKMVWKKGDSQVFEKDFDITSGRFRTWTRHTVSAGSWTVEVQDPDGKVLGSVAFTVS